MSSTGHRRIRRQRISLDTATCFCPNRMPQCPIAGSRSHAWLASAFLQQLHMPWACMHAARMHACADAHGRACLNFMHAQARSKRTLWLVGTPPTASTPQAFHSHYTNEEKRTSSDHGNKPSTATSDVDGSNRRGRVLAVCYHGGPRPVPEGNSPPLCSTPPSGSGPPARGP